MYDEIKAEQLVGTLTDENKALLAYIQPLLAEYTIIEATPEINLVSLGDGWKVVESTDGMKSTKEAQAKAIQHLITKAAQNADYYKAELEGFLYKNISDYPTFEASTANKDADSNINTCVNNTTSGGAFI